MSCKHVRPYQTSLKPKKSQATYLEICRTCGASRSCTISAAGDVEHSDWTPPTQVELGARKMGQAFVLTLAADSMIVGAHTLRHGRGKKGSPPSWVLGRSIPLAEIPVSVLAQLPERLRQLKQAEPSKQPAAEGTEAAA